MHCPKAAEPQAPGAHSEVIDMASYVSPKIRDKFETLSVDLKNSILERNVHLESLQDLIKVLEEIVNEGS